MDSVTEKKNTKLILHDEASWIAWNLGLSLVFSFFGFVHWCGMDLGQKVAFIDESVFDLQVLGKKKSNFC